MTLISTTSSPASRLDRTSELEERREGGREGGGRGEGGGGEN